MPWTACRRRRPRKRFVARPRNAKAVAHEVANVVRVRMARHGIGHFRLRGSPQAGRTGVARAGSYRLAARLQPHLRCFVAGRRGGGLRYGAQPRKVAKRQGRASGAVRRPHWQGTAAAAGAGGRLAHRNAFLPGRQAPGRRWQRQGRDRLARGHGEEPGRPGGDA